MSASPVSLRTKSAFGVGAAAEAAVLIVFTQFALALYNNVLGLSGTLVTLALGIAILFDAFSDPLIGSLSDRWRSRLGRRHPFMYAAPLPLAACVYAIFSPPALSEWGLFLWLTVFAVLLRTFLTFYHVPHLALGAELSADYRERTVVMSYNAIFGVIGGAGAFFAAWTLFGTTAGGTESREGYRLVAAGVAVFAALVIFASAFFTRDRIPHLVQPRDDEGEFSFGGVLREIGQCLQNRNYLMLLLGLFFLSATIGTRENIGVYMNRYFWELDEQQIRLFAVGSPPAFLVAVILAARLHMRFDKRETIMASVVVLVFAVVTPITLRIFETFPANHTAALLPTLVGFVFLVFLAAALLNITVLSALADIVDEHELLSGRRQEGIFFSARTFFGKLTSGLGGMLAGVAIDAIGFPAGQGLEPGQVDPGIVFRLGVLDGPIAAIPAVIAVFFYFKYDISKHRHREIQEALTIARTNRIRRAEAS